MKKLVVVLIIALSSIVNAQPYIYYAVKEEHPSWGTLEKIVRYNLKTNCTEDFFPDQVLGKSASCVWDQTQSFLVISLLRDGFKLYNCSNPAVYYDLGYWGSQINQMLFSKKWNKLFLFSDDYKQISAFSISADSISFEYNHFLSNESYETSLTNPSFTAFFSSDSNQIYIYNYDSNDVGQMWTFSIENKSIIEKKELSTIGFEPTDYTENIYGKNGKGIVCSGATYDNPIKDFYYRIYDYDNNTGSDFIHHSGLSEAYFANNENFLLILNTLRNDSTWEYYHTGDGYIYNTKSAQLIKTIQLPSKGIIYFFAAEPQNIYYIKNIEFDNREIYLISFDSSSDEPKVKKLFPK